MLYVTVIDNINLPERNTIGIYVKFRKKKSYEKKN